MYLCEDHVLLADVRCAGAARGWSSPRPAPVFGLVLLRDGVLRARVDGVEQMLDAGSVYVERLGAEQQFAHPLGPDAYTEIVLSEPRVAELLGGDPTVPEGLVMVTPEVSLAHPRRPADPLPQASRLTDVRNATGAHGRAQPLRPPCVSGAPPGPSGAAAPAGTGAMAPAGRGGVTSSCCVPVSG